MVTVPLSTSSHKIGGTIEIQDEQLPAVIEDQDAVLFSTEMAERPVLRRDIVFNKREERKFNHQ